MASPKKKKTRKKRRNRLLAFQDNGWENRRNDTAEPAIVSVQKCPFSRKRRHVFYDGRNDTVNRVVPVVNVPDVTCAPIVCDMSDTNP